MNIVFVHECYGSLGGAEANAFITATELRECGHSVRLLTTRGTGRNEAAWRELFADGMVEASGEGVLEKTALLEPDVYYMHKWSDLPSLREFASSPVPVARMVHDHDVYCLRSYRYNVFTRRVCRRPASPYCVFPCLAPIKRRRGGGLPVRWLSYGDKLEEIALNKTFNRHLVVTRYMREEMETNGFAPESIEIFPPVPREGDALRSRFSDRNLLLYAGQIIRGKGVDVLMEALAKVESRFEAVILGDGNHRAKCERVRDRLGLRDKVRFEGFIPQEQLKDYYQDTSAVMVSSLWPEPIATIGLEVMRYALPVVAFDAGGIRDWLHDGVNGYLVPWGDTVAYAAAIDRLLGDKTMARSMGEAGLAIVSRDYDFADYIARLDALLRKVSLEPPPAGRKGDAA